MRSVARTPRLLTVFLLFVISTGLLTGPGWVYAADRTVIGELFSADG